MSENENLMSNEVNINKNRFNIIKLNQATPQVTQSMQSKETQPDLDNYRNLMSLTANHARKPRPTIFELQNATSEPLQEHENLVEANLPEIIRPQVKRHIIKFGWIQGVLIRCILNIFGVMIFLRLSWVIGQAGICLATLIILIATLVTLITSLSTSAICTNGEVKGGGAYFLISRILGPEFGGAIGIVFSFANAVAAAMYIVGFAETVLEIFKENGFKIVDGGINDVRIIGILTLIILLSIALIGMSWESKVQNFLMAILCAAFINFLIGTFLPSNDEKKAKGYVGYSLKVFKQNLMPDFRKDEDFAHVFGIFFPAVTGILAGANISANLKNPHKDIPKGTLLSVFITSFIYLTFGWIFGATFVRDATGVVNDLYNGSISNCTSERECPYGLNNDYQVMKLASAFGPIVTAGIFSASLSSALASLVSAPKIFQAVCEDRIFPKIEVFAVGYGKNNEPWRGYVLTFVLALCFIIIGDLNQIAPIISNFFLMSYALINYSCFDASIAKTPGWRPSFKYYNKWVSLVGALVCLFVMFIIKWWSALLTFLVIAGLYLYVRQTRPDINWGSSSQAHTYRRSLEYTLKLLSIEEHVKNFRPQCLVLSGLPYCRPALCDFVDGFTKKTSLMICGNIKKNATNVSSDSFSPKVYTWFRKRQLKSFYTETDANNVREGALTLMQSTGVGKLKPNTLVMGFKTDWRDCNADGVLDYFQIINDAFQMQFGICILRVPGAMDFSSYIGDNFSNENLSTESDDSENEMQENQNADKQIKRKSSSFTTCIQRYTAFLNCTRECKSSKRGSESAITINASRSLNGTLPSLRQNPNSIINFSKMRPNNSFASSKSAKIIHSIKLSPSVTLSLNIFHRKFQNNFIDVWWLFDDGGLTILIPYLLSQRKYWHQCKLRVFIQATNNDANTLDEARNMAALLNKFRIKYHDIIVVSTMNQSLNESKIQIYERTIEKWRLKDGESQEENPLKISDSLIQQNQDKINFHIRLRDLLLEHSQLSSLIVITITVPTKMINMAALYLSWLDYISQGLPPVLMIRGNQTPVITFYS